MQPKAITTGLEAAYDICSVAEFGLSARSQITDQRQQRCRVASFDAVQSRLLAPWQLNRDKPRRDAQFNGDKDSVLGRHDGRLPDSSADAWQSEQLAWAVSALIASGTRSRSASSPAGRRDERSARAGS